MMRLKVPYDSPITEDPSSQCSKEANLCVQLGTHFKKREVQMVSLHAIVGVSSSGSVLETSRIAISRSPCFVNFCNLC